MGLLLATRPSQLLFLHFNVTKYAMLICVT
jgi:hypothetical protein